MISGLWSDGLMAQPAARGPSSSTAAALRVEANFVPPADSLCSAAAVASSVIFTDCNNSRPWPISHSKIQATDSAALLATQWIVPLLLIEDEMGHLLLKKTFLFPALTWLLLRGPKHKAHATLLTYKSRDIQLFIPPV